MANRISLVTKLTTVCKTAFWTAPLPPINSGSSSAKSVASTCRTAFTMSSYNLILCRSVRSSLMTCDTDLKAEC
jgi:hypothetical protein